MLTEKYIYDILFLVRKTNGELVQWENASLAAKRSGVRIPYSPPFHGLLAQLVEQ